MKKQIILRSLIGMPIGITIGYSITIVFSLIFGQGYYFPCEPRFVSAMGSEIRAVIVQTVLCAILGISFTASSVIWEIEHWSLAKQTGIYFLITSVVMMPAAYFTHWMEHSLLGFIRYFGIFALIFVIIWVTQFIIGKNDVNKMNAKLHKAKSEENK